MMISVRRCGGPDGRTMHASPDAVVRLEDKKNGMRTTVFLDQFEVTDIIEAVAEAKRKKKEVVRRK